MPGAIEDGHIEGDRIFFNLVRRMTGQEMKITWTGTLSSGVIRHNLTQTELEPDEAVVLLKECSEFFKGKHSD
jgi:hypothetical protein